MIKKYLLKNFLNSKNKIFKLILNKKNNNSKIIIKL
jgi:hypothetical protein